MFVSDGEASSWWGQSLSCPALRSDRAALPGMWDASWKRCLCNNWQRKPERVKEAIGGWGSHANRPQPWMNRSDRSRLRLKKENKTKTNINKCGAALFLASAAETKGRHHTFSYCISKGFVFYKNSNENVSSVDLLPKLFFFFCSAQRNTLSMPELGNRNSCCVQMFLPCTDCNSLFWVCKQTPTMRWSHFTYKNRLEVSL